jgi:hypothetical protein
MVPITNNDEAIRAKYDLERALLDGGPRQLLAGDAVLTNLTRDKFELCVEWGKLIFAWWDEENSQNLRVSAYEIDRAEVRLQVTRGIGRETAVLSLRDCENWRDAQETENLGLTGRRKSYVLMLADLLTSSYPDMRLQRATTGADRARSVPGRFARFLLRLHDEVILAIGVSDAESQADVDRVVAAGLVWLAGFNSGREPLDRAKRLWFCLPCGRSQTVVERLTLIDIAHLGASVECFEVDEKVEELIAVRPSTQDELLNSHPRELRWPGDPEECDGWRGRIVKLAPQQIEVQRRPAHDGMAFSINGLEFARVAGGEQREVRFGVAGAHPGDFSSPTRLTESNFDDLGNLVHEIIRYRSIDSPDRRHMFYRLREESWLESILRGNIRALDVSLDDRFVYSQIPAWRADERSVIDLLTINHEGRLVVIEIKTAEDPQLPLQGLDYWLRVEQARLRSEFEKRGMFTGIEIADRSALLYLIAPRLRFHRTFATVARCLAPQIEASQIGVNANWRSGVRVHSIKRVNDRGSIRQITK